MDDEYWEAVRATRLALAELLATLDPDQWDSPSLCQGWRVRDVAGHLALVPTITTWQMAAAAPRARFDPNRINTLLAVRAGSAPTPEIVRALRDRAGDRTTARTLDTRNALFDVIVHSQDIAVPLHLPFPVPVEHTRRGLERVWAMGWPFHAGRRLAGLRLSADDTDWTVGDGPEVRGPALALLLLLTGRTAVAQSHLVGAGVESLPVRP
jgi:uncharacterized protein (TIGR03083 family)